MSYLRVLPRDLFNEANLLKNYGQLALKLDVLEPPNVQLICIKAYEAFDVQQDPGSGNLSIINIQLHCMDRRYRFERPLNSREPWPLLMMDNYNEVEYPVFTDDGELSPEFLLFLKDWS